MFWKIPIYIILFQKKKKSQLNLLITLDASMRIRDIFVSLTMVTVSD